MWWSWNEFFTDMGKLIAGIVIVVAATYFGGNAEEKKGMKRILRKFWRKTHEYALLTSIVTGVMYLLEDQIWHVLVTCTVSWSLEHVGMMLAISLACLEYVEDVLLKHRSKVVKKLREVSIVSAVIAAVELWMFHCVHGVYPDVVGLPALVIFMAAELMQLIPWILIW